MERSVARSQIAPVPARRDHERGPSEGRHGNGSRCRCTAYSLGWQSTCPRCADSSRSAVRRAQARVRAGLSFQANCLTNSSHEESKTHPEKRSPEDCHSEKLIRCWPASRFCHRQYLSLNSRPLSIDLKPRSRALPLISFRSIDRTPHGLIFRDEPTETLIRRVFKNDSASQTAVIERLERRQLRSTYAARALPIVLTSLGRTDDLIRLAFDAPLPEAATSRVAQRAIRLSRLVAALVACSAERRANDLTELLLEAARVAGGHERSDAFLLEHPDLVAVSGDAEAVRRLFEVKSGWPGSRHASLALLYALSNEPGEARRNARRALAWLDWRARQPRDRFHPRERTSTDEQDIVGPAYVEALAGNTTRVGRWLDQWSESYAYTLYSQLARLLERHALLSPDAAAARQSLIHRAARCRSKSRALAAALLQHTDLEPDDALRVIRRLAAISVASGPVPDDFDYTRREHGLADAL